MLFLAHHPKLKLRLVYFLVVLTLIFSFGCFRNYFKINRMGQDSFKEMVTVGEINKKYFIHFSDGVWLVNGAAVKNDQFTGYLSRHYLPHRTGESNRYKAEEKYILEEVHLYVARGTMTDYRNENGVLHLPLPSIDEIHVYEPDVGATKLSYVFPFVVVGLIVAAIVYSMSNMKIDVR